jgi:acyl carrier protein
MKMGKFVIDNLKKIQLQNMNKEIKANILDMICKILSNKLVDLSVIDLETDLNSLGFDSFDTVTLIAEIDKMLNGKFIDEDFNASNFKTIVDIYYLVDICIEKNNLNLGVIYE